MHIATIVLAAILLPVQQETDVVSKILREGRANSRVMEHLDQLVNGIGPRLTSSTNGTKAAEWARDLFKSFGIENARLEQWGTFPVGFNRGPWSGKVVAPEKRDLECMTMSWTPGTDGPVEGPALIAPKSADQVTTRFKGAWVLAQNRPKRAIRSALEKVGAAGIVRAGRSELLVTAGNYGIKWNALPTQVNVYLKKSDFTAIRKSVEGDVAVRLRFDIRNEFVKGPIPLYNVIADIPGTEKPDEMVIFGGHIDSWDGATGTVDNGTGVATTLEAARLLMKAGARPKRTIRFMLWSGEEQGLLGSKAWIKQNRDQLKNISCVIVHDGGTNYLSGIASVGGMKPVFERVFAPVLKRDGKFPFRIRDVDRLPHPIGSDHDSFLVAGVPGFFWSQKGRANYFRCHHTQHDHFKEAIPEYQRHSALVVALGAWGLANEKEMLPREGLPRTGGNRQQRMLGVNLEEDGVTIQAVMPDSAADEAGLREGDKILRIGSVDVSGRKDLGRAKRRAKKETTVVILREEKKMTLPLTFKN